MKFRLVSLVVVGALAFACGDASSSSSGTPAESAGENALTDSLAHLPKAPTWTYGAKGEVTAGAVGSDYCNMDTGETCEGVNVLISGPPAVVLFNQMAGVAKDGVKRVKGIECALPDPKDGEGAKGAKCLFHLGASGPVAGETPWISD